MYRSGTHWIWNENWANSRTITTTTEHMTHLLGNRRVATLSTPTKRLQISTVTLGGNIAAGYSTHQFRSDHQLATHMYISLALQGGMNINDVAVQSGNSRSVIEKQYAKWIPNAGDIARLLAQIENAQK
jgi:hypothetical protein